MTTARGASSGTDVPQERDAEHLDATRRATGEVEETITPKGKRWHWRHPLIRNGEWSRVYFSRHAALSGRGQALYRLELGKRADGHVRVEIDGAAVHLDPKADTETIAAIRELVAAAKRTTAQGQRFMPVKITIEREERVTKFTVPADMEIIARSTLGDAEVVNAPAARPKRKPKRKKKRSR